MSWNFRGPINSTQDWGQTMFCNFATTATATDDTEVDLTYNEWVDWFPYKWKKYIPTWHLVRSYK